MAFKLDEIFVEIRANTASFNSAIGKVGASLSALQPQLEQISNAARNVLLGVGAGVGAGLKFAGELEEIDAKFQTVFKNETKAAEEFGNALASSVGRSRQEIKRSLGSFQDLFVPMGMGRKEARQLSQEMTKLAIDVASFNNVSDEEAITAFSAALTGSSETVKRFGIVMLESTIQAEALALGLAKSKKEISEQDKLLARASLIMKGTSDAQGDAARTSGSFTNQLKRLRGVAIDVSSTFGALFIPQATNLLKSINRMAPAIESFIKNNGEAIKSVIKWTAAIAAALFIGPKLLMLMGSVFSFAVGIGKAMVALAAVAVTPFGLMVAGAAAAAAAFIALSDTGQTFGEKLADTFKGALQVIDVFFGSTEGMILGWQLTWKTTLNDIKAKWDRVIYGLAEAVTYWKFEATKAALQLMNDLEEIMITTGDVLTRAWVNVVAGWNTATSMTANAIKATWRAVGDEIMSLWIKITGFIKGKTKEQIADQIKQVKEMSKQESDVRKSQYAKRLSDIEAQRKKEYAIAQQATAEQTKEMEQRYKGFNDTVTKGFVDRMTQQEKDQKEAAKLAAKEQSDLEADITNRLSGDKVKTITDRIDGIKKTIADKTGFGPLLAEFDKLKKGLNGLEGEKKEFENIDLSKLANGMQEVNKATKENTSGLLAQFKKDVSKRIQLSASISDGKQSVSQRFASAKQRLPVPSNGMNQNRDQKDQMKATNELTKAIKAARKEPMPLVWG